MKSLQVLVKYSNSYSFCLLSLREFSAPESICHYPLFSSVLGNALFAQKARFIFLIYLFYNSSLIPQYFLFHLYYQLDKGIFSSNHNFLHCSCPQNFRHYSHASQVHSEICDLPSGTLS